MSDARSLHKHRRLEPGINLTPMLDMIFNLIFFFILATQLRQENRAMTVHLPAARSAPTVKPTSQPPPVITLDAQGRMFYNGRVMVEAEIKLELHHLVAQGRRSIIVRGDRDTSYGRVVEVWDWCRQAGLTDAIMDVQRPGAGGDGNADRGGGGP